MIKKSKNLILIISIILVLAIVASFLLYNTYYADTMMNMTTSQNNENLDPSGSMNNATTSVVVSKDDQELAKKIFEIEKANYAGRNSGVGKIVRVKEYLRVDIGDINNDAIDTYLYRVDNNNGLTKIQMIDIEGTVVENNPDLGRPAYISQEDWQKLIFSNYE